MNGGPYLTCKQQKCGNFHCHWSNGECGRSYSCPKPHSNAFCSSYRGSICHRSAGRPIALYIIDTPHTRYSQ